MKILFVIENYIPHIGGVELVFKNLSEGLVKLGHEAIIVTHRLKGTKKFEIINGVKVYRIDCFYNRYLFTFFSIPKIISIAKKVDLLHTTTFNGAFPAWLVSKILKKKCIITIHEVWVGKWAQLTEINWLNAKIHNFLEALIYLLNFDKYVCISKSTQKQIQERKVKKDRIVLIYNGIDYNHWNPEKYNKKYSRNEIRKKLGLEKNFVYLFTGRPGISKGIEYLIKAVPLISKKIPDSKLLAIISKDKAYKKRYDYILRLINQLKIEDKVNIHPTVDYQKLPAYIKAVDCVVIPSLSEGFGFAVVEACAIGTPVVATDTTSIPEVVSGEYVLVKPKDPKAIAKGVEMVYKNKTIKSKLKKFESKDTTKNYFEIYKKFI